MVVVAGLELRLLFRGGSESKSFFASTRVFWSSLPFPLAVPLPGVSSEYTYASAVVAPSAASASVVL